MSQTLKAVRGTRDLLPPETALWNRIEATARDVFARYNFGEIRTPVFEDTSLFARSVGEETDIVSKEMFSWEDGERFDKEKLRAEWFRINQDNLEGGGFPSKFADVEFEYRDDHTEAVVFSSQVTNGAVKTLAEGVASAPEWKNFSGRIVIPATTGHASIDKLGDRVWLEKTSGTFNKS